MYRHACRAYLFFKVHGDHPVGITSSLLPGSQSWPAALLTLRGQAAPRDRDSRARCLLLQCQLCLEQQPVSCSTPQGDEIAFGHVIPLHVFGYYLIVLSQTQGIAETVCFSEPLGSRDIILSLVWVINYNSAKQFLYPLRSACLHFTCNSSRL